MRCEEIQELLPEYWAGSAKSQDRELVNSHLAECADCRESSRLWSMLGELPDEQPGPEVAVRFRTMLAAYRHGLEQAEQPKPKKSFSISQWLYGWWPTKLELQVSIAAACLAVGVAIGVVASSNAPSAKEFAKLHDELRGTREMVAVSLLRQQSASDRLRGVSWSTRLNRPDEEVLGALLAAVDQDPSVDVRLAAADALRKYANVPEVGQGMVTALGRSDSPLVQIALIDALVDMKDRRSVTVLKKLSADQAVNESVRQRANWAIGRF